MIAQKWWTDAQDVALKKECRKEVLEAFNKAEKRKKPAVEELFTDVFDGLTPGLLEQQSLMRKIVEENPSAYPNDLYAKPK
jgi:2-oxoisovalerate dehydrogenase E1 component alpha subunit